MKDKAKKIIRNILIGAVASLYNANARAAGSSVQSLWVGLGEEDKKDVASALKNKIYKNVLKVTNTGETKLIAGHRSHMSHRSSRGGGAGHASHSSHSSHSSSSYETTYSNPKPQPKTYKTYDLGDRSLTSGLYGNDVSKLTSLLVSKKYMHTSWITMQKGYPVFDQRVTNAVKRFQKDAGLKQDGVVTSSLADKLESWDSNQTTLILGIRDLGYDAKKTQSGHDINELIALLRSAGFPPDPSKLQYKGNEAVFTHDIETAVKLFQAYNGLSPNGCVDETTITQLRLKAK